MLIFNAGKTRLVSFDSSNNTGAIDVKMDGYVLEKKSIRMLGLTFSFKLDWGLHYLYCYSCLQEYWRLDSFYEVSFSEAAPHLYKSTIHPCMEYCCHICAGACSCYLELLNKLQIWIFSTISPSLATSLEPLAHHQNVASVSLFCRYFFGRCLSELAQLVPLPFSQGRPTHYFDRLHDFSVTIR